MKKAVGATVLTGATSMAATNHETLNKLESKVIAPQIQNRIEVKPQITVSGVKGDPQEVANLISKDKDSN